VKGYTTLCDSRIMTSSRTGDRLLRYSYKDKDLVYAAFARELGRTL